LVHCSAGKDRTGIIAAVVLSLCGVEDEAVAQEYALTDLGLAGRREEFVSHLVKSEALRGDREGAERMISAR
jgi:protein tyrosine/serine phosphatase